MSKIFIEFSAGLGPLIRCLPIAIELRKRGHTVRYFARDNAWKYMEQQGFEAINLDRQRVALKTNRINARWKSGDEFWGLLGFDDPEWLMDRQTIWQKAIADYQPDVIVADWGILSSIAARLMDIPLVMITQSCLHPGVRSGQMQYWLPPMDTSSTTLTNINQYLNSRGGTTLSRFEELHVGTAATIIPGFPEFDRLEPGWESKTVYTGPILASGLLNDAPHPPHLSQESNVPRIFCYTGRMRDSAGNSGEFLFGAVSKALYNSNTHLVIATGGMGDQLPRITTGGRCRIDVVDWVPMEVAYPNSRLIIHHGGHGSCLGLFQYGVPGLILPTHSEREYNAHVVAELGCGSFLTREKVNDESVQDAIHALLADSKAIERTRSYQKMLASRYPKSAEVAADTILGATNSSLIKRFA